MVDCGNPRCALERRSCRRDIQIISKKLPLILGLERIAADYVDEDTAKLFLNPYPAWDQELVQDFEPLKRCFHCDKKLPNIYKRIQRIIDEAKKGKENNGKICLRSLQDLMPFCLDFYTHGFGQELFSDVVKAHFQIGVQQTDVREESEPPVPAEIIDKLIIPNLAVDRLGRKQEVGKQGYTEEDLDSAVSDVRSGKIGTRKAAIIYGVPRSTIRNKIIKTEPEELVINNHCERQHIAETDFSRSDCAHNLINSNMSELSIFGLNKSKLARTVLSHVPTVPIPVSSKLDPDDNDFFLEQHLNHIRRLHNLNGVGDVKPRLVHSDHLKLPLLVDVVHKLVHQKFMEVKHDFGWKINSPKINSKHQAEIANPFDSCLPTFSPLNTPSHNNENLSAPVYKHIVKSIYTNMMMKDSPVSKPFGKVNECSRIGDTLKDIIVKSISEKIRIRDVSCDDGSLPVTATHEIVIEKSPNHCVIGSEAPQTIKESKQFIGGSSPPKRPKKNASQPGSHSETYSGFSSTKKTRPKRGQYRKYNSQLLMDAVKAVQRGEMSVHRAGSYYGVPHSTLEYKVKERHLLRQKKPRDMQSPSTSSRNSETMATIHTASRDASLTLDDIMLTTKKHSSSTSARVSSTSSPTTTTACNSKIPQRSKSLPLPSSYSSSPLPISNAIDFDSSKHHNSLAWFQPYRTSPSSNHDSTIGLTSSSFTLNNSASELLIKLQHKVHSKESSFPCDNAFSLSCLKGRVFDLVQAGSSGAPISDQLALYNEST